MLLWTGHVTLDHRPQLTAIAEAGFDGAEVPMFDASDVGHYRQLGALLDDLGLERTACSAYTAPEHNPVSPDPVVRQNVFDYARQVIDCAHAMGAQLVVGPLYQPLGLFTGAPPSEAELDRCADFLSRMAPLMRDAGMVCAIEPLNRFEAHVLNTAEQGLAMIERVNDPAIGILYDTFHAHIEEKDPVAALRSVLAAGRVAHVHIAENDRGTPGKGHAKIAEAIAVVKASDYDGWLTIEAFGKAVPELAAATRVWRDFFADPQDVVRDGYGYIRQCLD